MSTNHEALTAKFDPSASHISPEYRDGWNNALDAAAARIAALTTEVDALRAQVKCLSNFGQPVGFLMLSMSYDDLYATELMRYEGFLLMREVKESAARMLHQIRLMVGEKATHRCRSTGGRMRSEMDPDSINSEEVQQSSASLPMAGTLTHDRIRAIFLAHGFTIKPGNDDLKPYVYEAARAIEKEVCAAMKVTI